MEDNICSLFSNMHFIEQFVESVVSYTSKYNNKRSVSYAPDTIIGKPGRYPNYGDFPDTYMLRSYGKWWNHSLASQEDYMPQDVGPIESEDYLVVKFEQPVIATRIVVYETYNPGAVVRLWGGNGCGIWKLLWEGPPQVCAPQARLFTPPIKIHKELIHLVRIDFNQSLQNYHTSLDGVLLAGYRSKTQIQTKLFVSGFLPPDKNGKSNKQYKEYQSHINSPFSILPYEIMVYIFGYLDLKSLSSCARVNRTFSAASNDTSLYRNLSFKRYWHLIADHTLDYFIPKCKFLCKLDLSWCGTENLITEQKFLKFFIHCGKHLTHLSLGNCDFVGQKALEEISKCSDLVELRLRNSQQNFSDDFLVLGQLKNLRVLDLFATNIDDPSLYKILKNNPNLLHLNLDLCEHLKELDFIMEVLSTHNLSLRTLSVWKSHSLTSEGVKRLSKCHHLVELDIGWAFVLNDPGDCLTHIAQGCPGLTRLIISCWRGLGDHQLLPVIRHCANMRQIDLLGIRNISADICDRMLKSWPELELLDISFCNGIPQKQVLTWMQEYPQVCIQRSCEFRPHAHCRRQLRVEEPP